MNVLGLRWESDLTDCYRKINLIIRCEIYKRAVHWIVLLSFVIIIYD